MKELIGIDLGGTSTKFGIYTEEGELKAQWSISTDISDAGKNIVSNIVASLEEQLSANHIDKNEVAGIGMGSPGTVDLDKLTVSNAFNLNWQSKQEVGSVISAVIGLPFAIDNDANVAALGERWIGAGNNEPEVVFITLGTGVGGGIISNGQLIHGVAGAGGEIGHIVVEPEHGFICTCGSKGCLETVASATGVVHLAQQLAEQKPELKHGSIASSKEIFDEAQAGDEFALEVVEKVAKYLGLACGNLGNTLNPSSIIIGGGVSAAGEFLRNRVEKYFLQFTFPTVKKTTKIKLATLGSEAGIAGAANLARKFL